MEGITFAEILLKTVFCSMASDGHIDKREIDLINNICKNSHLFDGLNIQDELNLLVESINKDGKDFISDYFDSLIKSELTEDEELVLIDFAIQTIRADENITYSEIKFFKNIRNRLKINNENILNVYPDIEEFLEVDIINNSYLDKIKNQYLDAIELTHFDIIDFESSSNDNKNLDE